MPWLLKTNKWIIYFHRHSIYLPSFKIFHYYEIQNSEMLVKFSKGSGTQTTIKSRRRSANYRRIAEGIRSTIGVFVRKYSGTAERTARRCGARGMQPIRIARFLPVRLWHHRLLSALLSGAPALNPSLRYLLSIILTEWNSIAPSLLSLKMRQFTITRRT